MKTSEEVLETLIDLCTLYLDELFKVPSKSDFVHGEMTAFTECLENIQLWEKAESHKLDYEIANKYKI